MAPYAEGPASVRGPTLMLKGDGTCSESKSACWAIFCSFVSPVSDAAFGASEAWKDDTRRKVGSSHIKAVMHACNYPWE